MGIETTDLWKLVLERAELTPESEMLVDEQGRRLTFLEYKIAAEQMAAGLFELGVKEGDVVTCMCERCLKSMDRMGKVTWKCSS